MNDFSIIGKLILIVGAILVILGLLMLYGSKIPFIGRLPGDIHIKRGPLDLYFPITTCIIISLFLTLLFYLIRYFK